MSGPVLAASLGGLALLLALVAVFVLVRRRRAWREARAALRASFDRPFLRDFDVLVWRPGQETKDAAGLGFLAVGQGGIRLAVYLLGFLRFPRKVQPTLLLHPPECTVDGLVCVEGGWRVKISRGAERFQVADAASSSRAVAQTLCDAIEEAFGTRGPPELVVGARKPSALRSMILRGVGVALAAAASAAGAGLVLGGASRLEAAYVATPLLVVLASILVLARARKRRGVVSFYAEEIVVDREERTRVDWSGVSGYDDGASDVVQLLDELGQAPVHLAIPTHSESDRTALLALLDRKGLKRVER